VIQLYVCAHIQSVSTNHAIHVDYTADEQAYRVIHTMGIQELCPRDARSMCQLAAKYLGQLEDCSEGLGLLLVADVGARVVALPQGGVEPHLVRAVGQRELLPSDRETVAEVASKQAVRTQLSGSMTNRGTVPHLPVCHGLATTDDSSQQEAGTRACSKSHLIVFGSSSTPLLCDNSQGLTDALQHGRLHKVTDVHEPRIITAAHRGEEACHHGHISATILGSGAHQGCENLEVLLRGEGTRGCPILQDKR
jgi:hypothetical protein